MASNMQRTSAHTAIERFRVVALEQQGLWIKDAALNWVGLPEAADFNHLECCIML